MDDELLALNGKLVLNDIWEPNDGQPLDYCDKHMVMNMNGNVFHAFLSLIPRHLWLISHPLLIFRQHQH